MATETNNGLAAASEFQIVSQYDGMTEEEKQEYLEQMKEVGYTGGGIACKHISVQPGSTSFKIQGDSDDDEKFAKEIKGIIVFMHSQNTYWSNDFGDATDPDAKKPTCTSMDGSTGHIYGSNETRDCATCPYNQFGSDPKYKKGKACKNSKRIYLIMENDGSLYLLTVSPASLASVTKQLGTMMARTHLPYSRMIVSFTLQKTSSSTGNEFSSIQLKVVGKLDSEASKATMAMKHEIQGQYNEMLAHYGSGFNSDDSEGRPVDVYPTEAEWAELSGEAPFPSDNEAPPAPSFGSGGAAFEEAEELPL